MASHKKIGVWFIVAGLLLLACYWLLPWLPHRNVGPKDPRSSTLDNLGEISYLCSKYHDFTGTWPTSYYSLTYMITITNTNIVVDGWGHPFALTLATNPSTSFWIISYGADGLPGGKGSYADITMKVEN